MINNIKGFNSVSDSLIRGFEDQMNIKLPNDYRSFLKQYNGGVPDETTNSMAIGTTEEEMVLQVLFGLEIEDDLDLESWNEEYKNDLIENTLIIGIDQGGGLIVLINQDEVNGVYFWDHALELPTSTEDENTYKVSASFDEFIQALAKS